MNSQITLAKRKRNTHSEWNGRQNCEAFHWRKRQRKREWMREWSEQERVERSKKGKGEGSIIAMQLMLFLCRSVAVGLCLCLSVCVSVVPLAFSLFSSFLPEAWAVWEQSIAVQSVLCRAVVVEHSSSGAGAMRWACCGATLPGVNEPLLDAGTEPTTAAQADQTDTFGPMAIRIHKTVSQSISWH